MSRGKDTPVATLDNLVNIISKLKGEIAQRFASQAANVITRLLGGDRTLHAEIDRNNALQHRLAAEARESAVVQFGQFVASTTSEATAPAWALEWTEKRADQKTFSSCVNIRFFKNVVSHIRSYSV